MHMPCCYQALIESDEGVMWSSSATLAVASRSTLQARMLDEKESSSAAWSSAAPAAAAPSVSTMSARVCETLAVKDRDTSSAEARSPAAAAPFCRRLDAFCDATWNRMELMRTVRSELFLW